MQERRSICELFETARRLSQAARETLLRRTWGSGPNAVHGPGGPSSAAAAADDDATLSWTYHRPPPAPDAQTGPDSFSAPTVIAPLIPPQGCRLIAFSIFANVIGVIVVACRWVVPGQDVPMTAYLEAMALFILTVGIGIGIIVHIRRPSIERSLFGPYHLLRKIGAGGMGEVYLAEHRLLKRPCAVKLIHPESAGDPRALARFEQEVRLTATLSHPNTVEVYDYGRASDGTYYYVMEYLPGLSLAQMIEKYGPLPPGRVVYLLRQVCCALREAHDVGLIHRDLKPSNIVASRRGGIDDVAKLLDFGLVRPIANHPAADLTTDGGQIAGTPLFMSPEQASGDREADVRSDIYSLGAVAYFLLTGRPPFDRASGLAVIVAHVSEPAIPPSQITVGIPEDLERVVMRCLAKGPNDRFADAENLERVLGECQCAGDWDVDQAASWWREVGGQICAELHTSQT